ARPVPHNPVSVRAALSPLDQLSYSVCPNMSETSAWPFDHKLAIEHLTKNDRRLARLISKCVEFRLEIEEAQSPYEALLEAIAYQSISGKAAATIFARIKALGANGRKNRRRGFAGDALVRDGFEQRFVGALRLLDFQAKFDA